MRAAVLAFAALLLLAFAPASASAAFSLGSLTAAPASTQAGAHSDFTLHVAFPDTATDVKDLTIRLPPGLVGNPTATPKCTVAQLNADSCPASSQVGTVSTAATITIVAPVSLPLTVNGTLYNLTPPAGEPARFGIVLRPLAVGPIPVLPNIVLQSAVKLRKADFGLDTVINDIPNTASGFHTHIDSMDVHLQGLAGSPPKPFMRNPTSCTPATTGFVATDYSSGSAPDSATGTASFTPTGCDALDFSPTFSASIGSKGHTAARTLPPLTTVVDQDDGEAGVNTVVVLLPEGVTASTSALSHQCPVAAFEAGTCPANSVVGTATADSPLLTQPLTGPVTVVVPDTAGLPRLGLDLQGPLHIQLFGKFVLTPNGPGNEFDQLPDIPLSHFVLAFNANDLVVTQRDLCQPPTPTFATGFLGWNGAKQTGHIPAKVNGCGSGGGGGGGGGGGAGKVKAKVRVKKASTNKPVLKLVVKTKKGKAAAAIKKTKLKLPKKLRFSKGKAFKRNFHTHPHGAIRRKASSVAVTIKHGHATKLVEKAMKRSLVRRGHIARHKLHFKLSVKDSKGHTTKLKLTTKAKP